LVLSLFLARARRSLEARRQAYSSDRFDTSDPPLGDAG
jgi:hypothetical protein